MSESHAETRKDAEHILNQFPDGHGAVVNVARAYLDLLTEQDALREAAILLDEACRSGFLPAEFVRRADRKLAALPTPKQQENERER